LHYFSSVGKQEVAASLTHTKLDEFHSYKSSPGMQPISQQSEIQANSGSTTSKANSQSHQNNEIVTTLVGKIAAQNSANFEIRDHYNSVASIPIRASQANGPSDELISPRSSKLRR
jgi:hypothetical protein